MEYTTQRILMISEQYKCPVIDLARTFNPFDRTHYGTTEIEMPCKSGQFIVDIIIKILATWDWLNDKKKSKIFYGIKKQHNGNGIQTTQNNKKYRGDYFQILQNRALTLNHKHINKDEEELLKELFNDDEKKNDDDK